MQACTGGIQTLGDKDGDGCHKGISSKEEYFHAFRLEKYALRCLMPILHFVNSLIMFVHSLACYIVDFICVVKIRKGTLYQLYVEPTFSFHEEEFSTFRSLVDETSTMID